MLKAALQNATIASSQMRGSRRISTSDGSPANEKVVILNNRSHWGGLPLWQTFSFGVRYSPIC